MFINFDHLYFILLLLICALIVKYGHSSEYLYLVTGVVNEQDKSFYKHEKSSRFAVARQLKYFGLGF